MKRVLLHLNIKECLNDHWPTLGNLIINARQAYSYYQPMLELTQPSNGNIITFGTCLVDNSTSNVDGIVGEDALILENELLRTFDIRAPDMEEFSSELFIENPLDFARATGLV